MEIDIDYDCCIGSGMCARTAPTVFDQNDSDGRVVVMVENPEGESAELVHKAVMQCPSGALSIRIVEYLSDHKD